MEDIAPDHQGRSEFYTWIIEVWLEIIRGKHIHMLEHI